MAKIRVALILSIFVLELPQRGKSFIYFRRRTKITTLNTETFFDENEDMSATDDSSVGTINEDQQNQEAKKNG